MIQFQNARFRYEPYPLAIVRPALDEDAYTKLADSFPSTDSFGRIDKYDNKLSLSEVRTGKEYHAFISRTPPWREFHAWVKSDGFIREVLSFLKANNIDLKLDGCLEPASKKVLRTMGQIGRGRWPGGPMGLRSRFEFSALPADGGEVPPHTDTPKKLFTFVLSMVKKDEWPLELGGGLEVNRTTDPAYAFNWNNRMVPRDKMETLETVPFLPNQCIIFVKTFNSLHSVKKMEHAGSKVLRKTVTIVIERDD